MYKLSKISYTILILLVPLLFINYIFPSVCLAEKEVTLFSPSYFKVYVSHINIKQGDAVMVRVKSPAALSSLYGEFNNNPVFFDKGRTGMEYTGLMGIDMTLIPGMHYLRLVGDMKGTTVTSNIEFEIKERKYETETLTFPENMVELDIKTEERAEREGEVLANLWKNAGGNRFWSGDFKLPVKGRVKKNFGKRRILNGREKSPHNGVDIIAPMGRKVMTANRGKVVLTDEHFFGGKTIVIDHGQGVFTVYLHLSEILVKEGEPINKGSVIGRLGSTGRSKKPHLHWTARVNNARVDPLRLPGLR